MRQAQTKGGRKVGSPPGGARARWGSKSLCPWNVVWCGVVWCGVMWCGVLRVIIQCAGCGVWRKGFIPDEVHG